MKLSQFIEAANCQIYGGSEHQWKCYPNGHFMDIADVTGTEIGDCVFNRVNQQVYEITVYNGDCAFLWIDPEYKVAHDLEFTSRNVDPSIAWEDITFTKINDEDQILSLVNKIAKGEGIIDLSEYVEDKAELNFPADDECASGSGCCGHCHSESQDTEEYEVSVDVRFVFSIPAESMDQAAAVGKVIANNMKPGELNYADVCWIDSYLIKETVSLTSNIE